MNMTAWRRISPWRINRNVAYRKITAAGVASAYQPRKISSSVANIFALFVGGGVSKKAGRSWRRDGVAWRHRDGAANSGWRTRISSAWLQRCAASYGIKASWHVSITRHQRRNRVA